MADPASSTRRRVRWRAVAAVLVALLVPCWLFLLHPRTDGPAKADAVFVLGGTNHWARVHLGASLVNRGYAPMLVLSWEQDDPFCHHRAGVPRAKLICRRPDPYSTRGEARLITALAHQYGWHSLLVVTSDDQATRARVRLRRCWDGGLRVLTVGASPWWRLPYTTVYEAAALVKAEVWQRGC